MFDRRVIAWTFSSDHDSCILRSSGIELAELLESVLGACDLNIDTLQNLSLKDLQAHSEAPLSDQDLQRLQHTANVSL